MDGTSLRVSIADWQRLSDIGKRPRTIEYHAEVVSLILQHWPGDLDAPAGSVTSQVVTDFVCRVAHFSASRYNAIVSVIKATVPAARKLKRRPVQVKDRRILTHVEFSRLLEELDKARRSHGGLVVRFLAHTGLRINEARQLRWENVTEDCIFVPAAIAKNGHPRCIPFVNGIQTTLQALRRARRRKRVLPQAEVKKSLQAACRRARLPQLSHHDFRHLFATRCIQSGVDLPTVARWLGHRDGGALLARIYFHLADEHSRTMARRVRI